MLFNTPISRRTQPNFAEGSSLASVRDNRNTATLWKKNVPVTRQGLADNTALANIVQRLNKLQRRQIGYPQQTAPFYPFKIYQPTSGLPSSGISFDNSVNQHVCTLDPKLPTQFDTDPWNCNPTTDFWRIWMVRYGLVEQRPYYSMNFTEFSLGSVESNNSPAWGVDNTDYILPFDAPQDAYAQYLSFMTPIIIPYDGDFDGQVNFSFWIEINPDQNEMQDPSASIKGWRVATSGGDPVFSDNMMPGQTPFIIPVAYINDANSANSGTPAVSQFVSSNILNRYPIGSYTNSQYYFGAYAGVPIVAGSPAFAGIGYSEVVGALTYRGNWQNDSAYIQDMLFFPGDLITFNDSVVIGGVTVNYQKQCVCINPSFTTDPSTDTNYLIISDLTI